MDKLLKIVLLVLITLQLLFIFNMSNIPSNKSNTESEGTIVFLLKTVNSINNKLGLSSATFTDEEYKTASKVLNPFLRKVMHFTEYFILAFLIIFELNLVLDKKYMILLLFAVIICFVFANIDEFHQLFISGRNGNFRDVLVDTFGSLIGCLFYGTYYLSKKNKEV